MPKIEHKSDQIADEIAWMLKRGMMPDDIDNYPNFKKFIEENPFAAELIDGLTDAENYRAPSYDKQADVDRLVRELKRRRKRRSTRMRIGTAAAAAACIVAVLLLVRPSAERIENAGTIASAEHPFLIKGDGQVVSLEAESIDLTALPQEHAQEPTASADAAASFNQVIVPSRHMLSVTLPDGSKVILNAESSLGYNTDFGQNNRDVELIGEAYFMIEKSDIPFHLKMGDSRVTVYGTEFNADYRNEEQVEVVLVSGSIGFDTRQSEVIMKPGQLCRCELPDGDAVLSNVDTSEYTSWRDNEFRHKSISMPDLLAELALWYGVEFEYDAEELAGIEIYISSSRGVELEELLPLIASSAGVGFDIRPGKISVKTTNL